jgi:N-acetylmuramoyl-L-alanine amidase CwlA
MNITNKYITNNRPYEKRAKTTAIAVHYIGNPGTSAEANRNYFQNNISDVSSNYIIGLNGEIICCIPPDEVSWCTCQANAYSPSIECCHPDSTGKLNSKTYNSLVELCAYLCKKYKLDETDLIRHYDVTGKVCPKGFVPKSKGGSDDNSNTAWKKFKADVKAKLGGTSAVSKPTAKEIYRVRKSWSNAQSQIGAYSSLDNAKKACKTGYTVYDKNGKAVYTKAADSTIKVGSKVRVKSGAKDYSGNSLASFVYKSTYTVMEISGSRAVIGVNDAVTAAVHINNLIKV